MSLTTRLGFQVPNSGVLATPERMVLIAQRAESLGYDSMVVTDHVVVPRHIESRYPFDASGRFFATPEEGYLEALSTLSFLAAATRSIRLGPVVLVLPSRNPVLTAKMLATLDVLSAGRLFVGIGAGWLSEEFEILHAPPFENRGSVTDEWLEIFHRLWTEPTSSFDGRFYRFTSATCFPKPVQRPSPPIFVGGTSRAAIRRAARYGHAWLPARTPVDELRGLLPYFREQLALNGRAAEPHRLALRYGIRIVGNSRDRDRRDFEDPGGVFVGTPSQVVEQLTPLIDLEPTDIVFDCRTGDFEELLETMERLAVDVWPKLCR